MDSEKILVASYQYIGTHAGDYKVYEMSHPDAEGSYVKPHDLIPFIEYLYLSRSHKNRFDCCKVITTDNSYTINFGAEYEKSLAKELIGKLLAINTGCDIWECEDVVDECESVCTNSKDTADIQDIVMDYLGLDASYAWIFS